MLHNLPLVTTIATALGMALVLGFLAVRVKIPAIVGYLLAGVLIGPFTPGIEVNTELAAELAEIGIMLLMFYLTFNVIGAWLQSLLAAGIDKLSALADSALTGLDVNPAVHSLVIDGIFTGVGSVRIAPLTCPRNAITMESTAAPPITHTE